MDDLPHSPPAEVAKRLRSLTAGLTDAADIAAVNTYADELERKERAPLFRFKDELYDSEILRTSSVVGLAKHHR